MRSLRPRALVPLFFLFLFAILDVTPAPAQGFGKNKVQYEPLDWAVLETPHLRFHYYAEEESLARRLAAVSESVCVEYDRRFRVAFRRPIPLLLYSAHHLFQQTNATPGLISESVGGLTELIKGRVLIPHNGSWARLVWVTRHELAHAYMLEKLARVMKEHRRTQGYLPPLWYIEGLAEYCGTTWDAEAEGLLRDAVLSNRALPLTRSEDILGTVLMYKEGQSFLLYLAEKFGPEKVFDMMDQWHKAEDFETIFRKTFGRKLAEVDREWFAEIKRRYYPVVATSRNAIEVAARLTRRGHYNLGPRALPPRPGEPVDSTVRFCYFAASEGAVELMLNEPGSKGKRHDRRLLRGGQSPSFESFHLFQNRPDVSSSGVIAVSSKRGGRDALYLLDSRTRKVIRRLEFPRLVAILDPSLAPGDRSVVFSAQDYSGRSDVYRASWPDDRQVRLERLTNDDFDDVEPDVSPDGRWVVFASDRCQRDGHYSLFRVELSGGVPEPVSDPAGGDDRQPVYSPDGRWIAFRSTRAGISDLYVRPAETSREARRVTRLVAPAYDPDWIANGRGLLFTGQDKVEFQSYHLAFDPDTLKPEYEEPRPPASLVTLASATALEQSAEFRAERIHTGPTRPYERRLGFDLMQNGIAFDPGLGTGGGGQIAISDVLGNEQIYLFLANDADRFGGDFWDGFEGGVTYVNQGQRLNYGVGLFRLTQVYDADLDLVRRERRVGLLGLASYPFSKFTRLDGSVVVRHASDHLLRSGKFTDVDLVSHYLSLVHDNTGWTQLGPSSGSRWIVSTGFTRDMTSGAGDFTTLTGEYRHYLHPLPVLVSATRVQGQSSFGQDAQRFYLGGRATLRGYPRRQLSGLQTVLVQQELRLPLVRGLTLAVPAAWTLPTISAALFADAGWGWEDGVESHLGNVGAGFYLGGGYFPAIRWNYVWTTPDFRSFAARPRTQFTIGFNF
jgi:Tol biopolymer transport system component